MSYLPPTAWVALAVALLVTGARSTVRVGALAERGRLARDPARGATNDRQVRREVPLRTFGIGVVAVCSLLGWFVGGPAFCVTSALVAITGWMIGGRAVNARTRRRDTDNLLRAVRVLAGELSAGAGPPAALSAAAALAGADGPAFADAAARAERGIAASDALLAGRPGVRAVGHAWRIGEDSGAALAVVLDRVAADLAAEVDQRRAVTVALAGPRSSSGVLAGLPVLGIGLGIAMDADPLGFLIDRPIGRLVCSAGIVLDLAGIIWMAHILRRAEAP